MGDGVQPAQMTSAAAQLNFDALCDRVSRGHESVIIRRAGGDIAMISADEYESLVEFAYLFGSAANARRLLDAMSDADRGEGITMTLDELATRLGIERDAIHAG